MGGTLPTPRDYPTLCNLEDQVNLQLLLALLHRHRYIENCLYIVCVFFNSFQYLILFGGFNSAQGEDTAFADVHCLDIASGKPSFLTQEGNMPVVAPGAGIVL